MRRRHLKLWTLWLLPLLLARALIPTGFMLSASADGLQLTFCSSDISQPAQSHESMAGHHEGMHHGVAGDAAAGASHQSHHAPCPFSLAASAAPCEIPYLQAALDAPVDESFQFQSAPAISAGPVRADRIRGPPVLA